MKNLHFFTALLFIFVWAICNTADARWEITEQKGMKDIKVGDTIALEFLNFPNAGGRYLAGSKLSAAGVVTDDNAYLVEEGPLDIRTGAPTVYLKRLIDDPTRGEGQNGYLKYNGDWQTITYDPAPANAANLQIISCYGKGWTYNGQYVTNEKSVAFSYSTGENLDDFTYLGSWGNPDNIWFWKYTDTNQWNVYGMEYIYDPQGDLQALIDMYLEEGEYVAGTDPGFYETNAVKTYSDAMGEAIRIVKYGSDEELKDALSMLRSKYFGHYFCIIQQIYIPGCKLAYF